MLPLLNRQLILSRSVDSISASTEALVAIVLVADHHQEGVIGELVCVQASIFLRSRPPDSSKPKAEATHTLVLIPVWGSSDGTVVSGPATVVVTASGTEVVAEPVVVVVVSATVVVVVSGTVVVVSGTVVVVSGTVVVVTSGTVVVVVGDVVVVVVGQSSIV